MNQAKKIIRKLKQKWGIERNCDFVLIMLVFSLAGLGVSFLRKLIFAFLGLNHAALGVKVAFSLLLIVPLYQLSTLFFALPLGQFPFFLNRQKQIVKFLRQRINRLSNNI